MIIPWLKGFLSWRKAPITWALIALNILIFMATMDIDGKSMTKDFATVDMMVMTGRLYYQFQHPEDQALPIYSYNEWLIQGGQGLKDPAFIEKAQNTVFFGDQLAIEDWRAKILNYSDELNERNSRLFGLQAGHSSPFTWITYQFMHASWMHLFGNMMMLLLFGAALEQYIGGLALIWVYLISGCAGAWMFLWLGHDSLAPMIGASGSLSGVMAFYAAFEKKKRVAFFYFVSPIPGYYGWIYLPTAMLFLLCFLSDFVGYMSTPTEIGTGIAYTAHMGGAILGALLGYALKQYRQSFWLRWLFQH